MVRARSVGAVVGALALGMTACGGAKKGGDDGAAGDSYPEKNIEVIVPFTAGGPTDTVTRLVAEPMSQELGKQVVVRNVEGAGGTRGAADVAKAKNDGYTILLSHIGMSTAPALYPNLAYKPVEDFETVGLVTEVPMTVIANKKLAPNTLEELIAYAKSNDGLRMGTSGVGSASHLCGTLFQKETGLKLKEVPYDGAAPMLTALLGGEIDFVCDQTTNTTEQIKADGVKTYAVTTPERLKSLPDIPTTKEAGLPGLLVSSWHGIYTPADTDPAIIAKLESALKAALKDQNVIDKFEDLGTAPVTEDRATPEALTEQLTEQIGVWGNVLKGIEAGG